MSNYCPICGAVLITAEELIAICGTKEIAERIVALHNLDQEVRQCTGRGLLEQEIKIGGTDSED